MSTIPDIGAAYLMRQLPLSSKSSADGTSRSSFRTRKGSELWREATIMIYNNIILALPNLYLTPPHRRVSEPCWIYVGGVGSRCVLQQRSTLSPSLNCEAVTHPFLVSAVDAARLQSLDLIALTILLFDHLLTFGDEVKYIWKCKTTPFSALFLMNRYFAPIAMICYVVGVILPYNVQEQIYPKFQPGLVFGVLAGPTVVIAEAILILRVYAVYQRNKFILAFLASLWMVHVGLGLYVVITHTFHSVDLMRMSYAFNIRLGLVFFLRPVLFDSVIAGFLTFGLYQRSKPYLSEMPLVNLIIWDGLLYFFAVFGSNMVWLIIGLLFSLKSKSNSLGFAPMYIISSSITTTMVGRLTLNLREYGADGNSELTLNSLSLRFVRSKVGTSDAVSALREA